MKYFIYFRIYYFTQPEPAASKPQSVFSISLSPSALRPPHFNKKMMKNKKRKYIHKENFPFFDELYVHIC